MKKFAKVCAIAAGGLFLVGFILCLIGVGFGGREMLRNSGGVNGFCEKFLAKSAEMGVYFPVHYIYKVGDNEISDEWEDAADEWGESMDEFGQTWEENWNDGFGEEEWGENWSEDWEEEWSDWDIDRNVKALIVNGTTIAGDSFEETFSVGNIKEIAARVGVCEVKITTWEKEEQIGIRAEGRGMLDYEITDDGVLKIEGLKGIKNGVKNGLIDENNKIFLYVPEDMELSLFELAAGAGDIEIENLSPTKFVAMAGAAAVNVKNVTCDTSMLQVVAGDMTLRDFYTNSADVKVGMGSLDMRGDITGDLKGNCAMGDISLTLDSSETDHNYTVAAAGGEIEIGNNSYVALASGKELDNHADSNFDLACSLGSLSIAFQ